MAQPASAEPICGPMNTQSLRPRIDQLVLCLYDRPHHPELIETVALRRVERAEFTLTVRLTPTGHVISWDSEFGHLTEVATATDQPVPVAGQLFQRPLRGDQIETLAPMPGVFYQVNSQIEELPPELFPQVHEEILLDANQGLVYYFQPQHRLALPPIGFILHEGGEGYVSLSAFHSFPDEFCIVKTQTLIEFGEGRT